MAAQFDALAQKDADDSAKIAYIGVIKSMNALKVIYEWNEDLRHTIITLLAEAEKLRKGIDQQFPGHLTFKRPGFDE
jgi:hypothetical protein